MYKKLIPITLLFSASAFSQIVKDTLWFDKYGYSTDSNTAKTYKVLTSENGNNLLDIEEYNSKTNILQSKGQGYRDSSDILTYQGELKYYSPQGKEESTYLYEEGQISKILSTNPYTGEKYEGEFLNGSLYNGKAFQKWQNAYFQIEVNEGHFSTYIIIDTDNQNHRISYEFDEQNNIKKETYYDRDGKITAEATYLDGMPLDGTVTNINTENFSPLSFITYEDKTLVSSQEFYQNEKIKSESEILNHEKIQTFYDKDGKVIGKYSATLDDNDYPLNQNGTLVGFDTYGNNPDLISYIYTYENNASKKKILYYTDEQNNIENISYYKDEYITKIEYFDRDGTVKGELTYDEQGYYPQNGTQYEQYATTVYKDGQIIEKTSLYSNGKIFEKTDDSQSIYYDKNGKELGRLTYKKSEYGYNNPNNGSLYYNDGDDITTLYKYKDGIVEYTASYSKYNDVIVLEEENFYNNNSLVRKVNFYPNGTKQKEEIYQENSYAYEPDLITYFNEEGKLLSTFAPGEKEGTKYDFFADGKIQLIEKYKGGVIQYKKQYELENSSWWTENSTDMYLFCEIDYNKEGKFYSPEGELMSTALYKNGKPFSGKVYEKDSYLSTETEYKNGQKDGIEMSTYNNEIYSKTYYQNGEKTKEELFSNGIIQSSIPYKNDIASGEAAFYDDEGEVISTLIYKDGQPYSGTYISKESYYSLIKITYEEGNKISKQIFYDIDTLVFEEKILENGNFNRFVYDTDGNIIYKYEMDDSNRLNGDFEYYENGKIKYKATIKEGKLITGTVAIQSFDYSYTYGDSDTHTVISVNKDILKLQVVNNTTKTIEFNMEAKIKKDNSKLNPILSKTIEINNLYPYNEYNNEYSSYY
jgi:antitoxin component YwqK of YwqJK toxin-antitoxin module